MGEVLDVMVSKVRVEAEDAQVRLAAGLGASQGREGQGREGQGRAGDRVEAYGDACTRFPATPAHPPAPPSPPPPPPPQSPPRTASLQRLLLASLNGLAGLLLLQGLLADAVRAYREALATSECGWPSQAWLLFACCLSSMPVSPFALHLVHSGDLHFYIPAVDRNKAHIRADKLQQLHTLHNLAGLLGPGGRCAC